MASLSGIFQRPALAVSAVAVASVSADFYDKSGQSKPLSDPFSILEHDQSSCSQSLGKPNFSWVSRISGSNLSQLSFITRFQLPVPGVHMSIPNYEPKNSLLTSSTVLFNLYKSVDLLKTANPTSYSFKAPSSPSDVLYQWNLPDSTAMDTSGRSNSLSPNSKTVVVLLGWLGAKQKHLRKYAEWYTSRGFHAITFTFPMSEVMSYQVGGKAEHDVELLVNHLAEWMEEEDGKNLVFHTFSNTGWLTYGVMLEKFQMKDSALTQRIKGCIVDSAPVAAPDPQVWASGFSAAFLKKNSVATKSSVSTPEDVGTRTTIELKPAATEAILLALLEKIFGVVLSHPAINRRLSEVLTVLTTKQPACPQLYIYSSADKVIPDSYVESFIEEQRRSGRRVRGCNFVSSPHVDHFRNNPTLYSWQLQQFLKDCI